MPMKDGYRTLISFNNIGNTRFAETAVKPPGLSGRGPIDTTSMRNNKYTTKWPKSLRDMTNMTSTVQYDPAFITDILNFVLLFNQTINVKFPNNQSLQFYGWADTFEPNPMREGEVPLSEVTVVPSNINPLGFEFAPVLVG